VVLAAQALEEPTSAEDRRLIPMLDHVHSILIVKLSSIGDVVQSLPVLAALRRRFPAAHIAWAIKSPAADVVADSPHLDETLVLGGGPGVSESVRSVPALTAPLRLARALRARKFDVALDMQGLFKSALVTCLSGAAVRIGFDNLQEGAFLFINRRVVPDRRDVHAVEGYLGFADALGAPAQPLDFTIATSEADRRFVGELLEGREDLLAFVPGGRWLSKRWYPDRFAAVTDALAGEFGCAGVVVGGADDRPLAQEIAAAARSEIIDLTGRTTLKQLAEVFRRCRITIANETGPLYISAAVGTPTVAIFGPTDPRHLGPYGEGHAKVSARVACAPCRRRRCRHLVCMDAVAPAQVIEAARELLRGANRRCESDSA
jgi:lipopolysaccharide heptosyltransferase I